MRTKKNRYQVLFSNKELSIRYRAKYIIVVVMSVAADAAADSIVAC